MTDRVKIILFAHNKYKQMASSYFKTKLVFGLFVACLVIFVIMEDIDEADQLQLLDESKIFIKEIIKKSALFNSDEGDWVTYELKNQIKVKRGEMYTLEIELSTPKLVGYSFQTENAYIDGKMAKQFRFDRNDDLAFKTYVEDDNSEIILLDVVNVDNSWGIGGGDIIHQTFKVNNKGTLKKIEVKLRNPYNYDHDASTKEDHIIFRLFKGDVLPEVIGAKILT